MRKLMLMFAVVAMLAIAAMPALAHDGEDHDDYLLDRNNLISLSEDEEQNEQDENPLFQVDQEQVAESGDLNQESNVVQNGSNNVQAVNNELVGNTGNVQEQTSVIQYGSENELD